MVVRMGALLTVLSIVLMACSPATDTSSAETPSTTESPDSATTQPTSSPTPAEVISEISNEEYLAAVASIEDFLDSTSLGFDEGSRASLADFMATVDGVAEAGVSDDGTVWARFTDGREHAVFLNRASGPAAGEDLAVEAAADLTPVAVSAFLAAGGGASLLTAAQAPSGAELPGANTVVIMNGLGNSYDPPPAQLGAWFETKGYGVSSQSPTVDALKSISGVGVLIIRTHGGCYGRTLDRQPTCGLFTATPVTPESIAEYAEDLEAGRLRTGSAGHDWNPFYVPEQDDPANGNCTDVKRESSPLPNCRPKRTSQTNFVITPAFIEHYWAGLGSVFPGHSLVVFDNCTGAEFIDTVLAVPGVSAFAGWSSKVTNVTSDDLMKLLFDRLLGINEEPPDEKPEVRPFDVASVAKYMEVKGRIEDPHNPGTFLTFGTQEATILSPTIEVMDVFEGEDELWITGMFGSRSGEVFINSSPVDIVDWQPNRIRVSLDDTGARSAGIVEVVFEENRSNPVPLSEWRGTASFETKSKLPAPCLRADVAMDLHIRADVHNTRRVPWEDPYDRDVHFVLAGDSKATVTVEGRCEVAGALFELTGGAELPTVSDESDHQRGHVEVSGLLRVQPVGIPPTIDNVDFHVHLASNDTPESKLVISGSGMPTQTMSWPIPQFRMLSDRTMELDEAYHILEGEVSSDGGDPLAGLAEGTLRWDRLAVTHAPSLDNPPPA